MRGRFTTRVLGALTVPALLLTACGGGDTGAGAGTGGGTTAPAETGTDGGAEGGGEPITIGVVTATSGPLATYGNAYLDGLEAGLDYATDGTGEVDGRAVELQVVDSAGAPEQAISAATELVGQGVNILVGTVSSGVGVAAGLGRRRTGASGPPDQTIQEGASR